MMLWDLMVVRSGLETAGFLHLVFLSAGFAALGTDYACCGCKRCRRAMNKFASTQVTNKR